jgi:hypothetical protein
VHTGGKHPVFCGPQTLDCLTKVLQRLLDYRFYVVRYVTPNILATSKKGPEKREEGSPALKKLMLGSIVTAHY